MEIFGGFMVMVSIIGLFLAIVWLIMPFVVFAIKNKQDRSLEVLEGLDKRLAAMELQLKELQPKQGSHEIVTAAGNDTAAPAPDQAPQPAVLPLA